MFSLIVKRQGLIFIEYNGNVTSLANNMKHRKPMLAYN